MRKLSLWFGVTGMLLMPFSTSPEQGVVFAFGLPFIFAAVILNIIPILNVLTLKNNASTLLTVALLFSLVPVITALLSPEPFVSMYRASVFLLGYLFALFMISISNRADHFHVMTKAFFAGGVVLSTYYIVNFITKGAELGFNHVILERYVGGAASLPWGASNVIAGIVLLTLVGYFSVGRCMKIKWGWLVPVLCLSAIALTFSRSVIFLSLTSLVLLVFPAQEKIKTHRITKVMLITFFVLVIGAVWVEKLEPDAFGTLLSDRLDNDSLSGGNGRVEIWADRFNDLPDAFLSPNGYYSSLTIYDGLTSHNYFITTGLEQGAFGIAIGLFFWVLLFKFLGRHRFSVPRYRWIWLIVLMHLFVEDLNFTQQYAIAFWSLFALCVAHCRLSVSERNEVSLQAKTIGSGG